MNQSLINQEEIQILAFTFPSRNQYSERRTDVFLLWFLGNRDAQASLSPSSSLLLFHWKSSTQFSQIGHNGRCHCFPPGFMKLHVWVEERDVHRCPPSWGFFCLGWVCMGSLSTARAHRERSHAEGSRPHCLGKTDYQFLLCQIPVFLRRFGNVHKYFNENIVAWLHSPGEPEWPRREVFWKSRQSRYSPWVVRLGGALAANACRTLNHKTFKIHNSLTQNHRGESKNGGSKVTLYYFTALFSPQYCEVLTETVKNRFCSINSPITAVLLLSATSAVSGGRAATGKDSSTI